MTSTFAAQLRTIAAHSTNELDLRARRDAHAESLLFERSVAIKQDWDTIYQICLAGFQELCLLDSRLLDFQQHLYSPQSKTQDREQLTSSENENLDVVLSRCLGLLGSKVLLRPGIKAVEWLVRRFRVHVYNTGALLATFLPYHETTVFRNVLSIIPANKIASDWKFLGPYHKDASNVPRHAIVYSSTHNDGFFTFFNTYTLQVCQEGAAHAQLMRFWSTVTVESVIGRLGQVRSGRKEVQRTRTEEALLKILPVLQQGLEVRGCPELTVACFTLALILAGNAELEDHVIDSLTKDIAPFIANGEVGQKTALVCLAVLVSKKEDGRVPRDVLDTFIKGIKPSTDFAELHREVPLHSLFEALVRSALSGLKVKILGSRVRFVECLMQITRDMFDPVTKSRLLAIILAKLLPKDGSRTVDATIHTQIVKLLQALNDSPAFSPCFASAALLAGLSQSEVEALLEGTIRSPPESAEVDAIPMDVDSAQDDTGTSFEAARSMLSSFPPQSTELSFMAGSRSSLFDQLAQAFALCRRNDELMAQFEDLPLWRQKTENPADLHTSFLLRLSFSTFPVANRHAGLQLLARTLERGARDHTQLLIPYITVLLCDDAQPVRRAAVACMLAVQKCITEQENGDQHGAKTMYDALLLSNIKHISSKQALKLLNQVYLPHMEECVLDPAHMLKVLQAAFGGREGRTLPKDSDLELKKGTRDTLLELLTVCALGCPLLRVKVALVELLSTGRKTNTSSTTKTLVPILKHWSSLTDAEAEAAVSSEGLKLDQVDSVVVQLVPAKDKETLEHILALLFREGLQFRPALLAAFFNRITTMWKDIKDAQKSVAVQLFEMSVSDRAALAAGSRGVLHTVTLSSEALATVLEHSISGLAEMEAKAPPKKRRRMSQGRESIPKDVALELNVNESRLTLALELVENSGPESHPDLLAGLFEILIVLRRLKQMAASESPYLLNLCLSSILAIVDRAQQTRTPLDLSLIRADLVTDCVRSSENPQVQSVALLLSASLASLAPDRILHTIMPIFTFMGNRILSNDDDRSIYVTNRAIDDIIPPLVASLKKQDAKNLIHSTSNLLSSFVAAYSHVPQHRRIAFYQRLLTRLGADDFAFAVISLLASRRHQQDMSKFFTSLVADLSASTQVLTFRKLIGLSIDAFAEHPHDAEPLLDISRTTPIEKREHEASIILETAATLLTPSLKTRVKRLSKTSNDSEQEIFWTEFKTCISRLLGMLKSQKTQHSNLTPVTRRCLSALLELPSLADQLGIMPQLLKELSSVQETQGLQPLALKVLATQLQRTSSSKDGATQAEAVSFLPTLQEIIGSTEDESFRHAAIQCLDRIVEVYGRTNPDAVTAALSCLIEEGNHGLDSPQQKTKVMSLLCLATGVEILKEGAVPIVLGAMSPVLHLLRTSAQTQAREVHNACYTLLSSFITHVSFMISDENVTEILEISYRSHQAMPAETESSTEALGLVATKLGIETVTISLTEALKKCIAQGLDLQAITALIDVLQKSITHNTKSKVIQSAQSISTLILQGLSLRQYAAELGISDVEEIQSKLNALGIAFIYKLNDTTFRPIFEGWVDWAVKVSGSSADENAVVSKMTSFFAFAGHFFETLKSIVTSYASYLVPSINDILGSAISDIPSSSMDQVSNSTSTSTTNIKLDLTVSQHLHLYEATLSLLTTIATHDADSFFTSPSHFQPLATHLVNQFTLLAGSATKKPSPTLRQTIVDSTTASIIALATAVQDVPAHHHAINHLVCKLRHSASPATRLASIKTHVALTESDVGEEWIQNVVLGHASSAETDGASAGASTVGVGGSGETMVYVNEMLEDDDEDVERCVRAWVRMVRERVGEDVFEV